MSGLVQRLNRLETSAPDILKEFYEQHLHSFSVKPGSSDTLSVTSTCYALLAIQTASSAYDSIVAFDRTNNDSETDEDPTNKDKICIPTVVRALLASEWRQDDLFQVPLLLFTVLTIDKDRSMVLQSAAFNEQTALKIRQLIQAVVQARPKRRIGQRQVYSDYITYQVCNVLALLQGLSAEQQTKPQEEADVPEGDFVGDFEDPAVVGGLPANAVPEGAASEISLGLARCAEVAANELCRQLAYRVAGDTTAFDVMQLAYSLLTYVQSTQSLTGVAGRELIPGQGVSPGTQVTPLNKRLVVAALDAFFAEQHTKDGLWDKGQPIYQSFRRQGRNVGNAFVFSVDTVGSMLRLLPAEYFRPHLQSLERTLDWIEGHETLEVIPDYCDPESGECYGKALKGWASPHLRPESGPQAWSTAQVLACVSLLKTTIRELMNRDVLQEFGGTAYSEQGPRQEGWDRLLDTDLGSAADNKTIKEVLEERVVTPFSVSINNPSFGAAYSAILFGPPGTAKTTICEALAQKMGYDFLVIDTTAFLADGLTNVANRIRYVFGRLMALQECVILFDEIEEFALNRETPGLSMESRMLTTSMLTAINDLRRGKQSIFFVATNRLRAFDSAITRPGRFDMQLFVGTPNLGARIIQFQSKLPSLTKTQKEDAIASYRSFLESVWTEDAMFMNYLEGLQFASACASLVKSSPTKQLVTEPMADILAKQAAVMTVRGQVRDEYLASMKLSRV
ncbi:metalloprotease FTSH [Seminavis robusta]|uniref:Metalloprotease FTSH n=1 Tax=Seminavis robusta TaxID=568900 RepID=A0A9N8HS40_9STRA|nr:metalloprotease FTSH [Seminavis robusta]|eukprot:Sro1473_g275650.1 metalloprotease FTSH (735) ;mRNA; f:18943-21147